MSVWREFPAVARPWGHRGMVELGSRHIRSALKGLHVDADCRSGGLGEVGCSG